MTETKGNFVYEYARPALTVDCVVFGLDLEEDSLEIMLIQRDIEPFEGCWALPGGFVRENEDLEAAAKRELQEEAGLEDVFLEQLFSFGKPDRDPRGHTVSVAYYALVSPSRHFAQASTDARDARWFSLNSMPELAFDHKQIVDAAIERLRGKVRYRPVGFELLPEKFTLSQLQRLYEIVLEQELDKRNFQRKVHRMNILIDTGEVQQNVAHRAARFYKFNEAAYKQLERDGFEFSI